MRHLSRRHWITGTRKCGVWLVERECRGFPCVGVVHLLEVLLLLCSFCYFSVAFVTLCYSWLYSFEISNSTQQHPWQTSTFYFLAFLLEKADKSKSFMIISWWLTPGTDKQGRRDAWARGSWRRSDTSMNADCIYHLSQRNISLIASKKTVNDRGEWAVEIESGQVGVPPPMTTNRISPRAQRGIGDCFASFSLWDAFTGFFTGTSLAAELVVPLADIARGRRLYIESRLERAGSYLFPESIFASDTKSLHILFELLA